VRITVFAGSSRHVGEPYVEAARALGREIARRKHLLVYGGGRTGLMGAVADAALAAGGRVHGVILRRFIESDVHHLGVDLFEVDDMRSRKAGLDEKADAFVSLPGGLGTLEELTEILSFRKLELHHRRIVLLNTLGFFEPLLEQIERAIAAGLEKPRHRDFFALTGDPREAVRLCEAQRRKRSAQRGEAERRRRSSG
jgi:uncharacterized protein (TIGR00730 family)